MDEKDLWQTWTDYLSRLTWLGALRHAETEHSQLVAQNAIDALPSGTALEALTANAQLVELLVGGRRSVINAAREAGKTWDDIGVALGLSPQGAESNYRGSSGQ
jgi:hypothetical protein